jgi:hypothetical protein
MKSVDNRAISRHGDRVVVRVEVMRPAVVVRVDAGQCNQRDP